MRLTTLFVGCLSILATSSIANSDDKDKESSEQPEKIRVVGSKESGIELTTEKILKVPGAGNDPLRAVESLPGVVLANGFAPAVRGSSPADMYYQTDGVPVGSVFHNDSASTFHPNLIKSFELKTGAWESEFSDAIGGVISTELREPKFEEFSGVFDFSLLRTGILVESQLSDNSAFYFAMRQSLVHLYIENLLDEDDFKFTQAPINDDYQFKYLVNINDDNKLVVQATGANDDVGLLFSDDSKEVKQNPDLAGGIGFGQYYHNQSIIWTNYNFDGETTTVFNRLERNSDLQVGRIIKVDAVTNDYLFKTKHTRLVGDDELTVGFEYKSQNVDYLVSGKNTPCNEDFEVCPPSYFSPEQTEENEIDIAFTNLFIDYDKALTERLSVRVGGVLATNDFNDESIFEPRLAANFDVTDEYRVKFAYGEHHQWFREYKYLSETFGTPSLDQEKAKHYVIGLEYEGESDWAWRVEAYSKKMDNLIVSNPVKQVTQLSEQDKLLVSAENYLNLGKGNAEGIEFLINKAVSDNWYGWLSIAYSKTERVNQLTGEKFNYEFDLPWIVNLVANYEFNDKWQLGGRWRYQSGNLYTPIVGAEAIYDDAVNTEEPVFYDPIEAAINSERLESFHRLDVRLDYKTIWFGKDTNIYFEILNLYGKKSLSGYEYNEDYSEKEPEYQFPESPIPSIGIQINF